MIGRWRRFCTPKPQPRAAPTSSTVGDEPEPVGETGLERQPWLLGDARALFPVLPQSDQTPLRVRLPAPDGEEGVREAVLHEVEQTVDQAGNPVIVLHATPTSGA